MKALTWHGKQAGRAGGNGARSHHRETTDVVVKVTSTGLCGSDLHLYDLPGPFLEPDDILGHEPMGTVAEVSSSVESLRWATVRSCRSKSRPVHASCAAPACAPRSCCPIPLGRECHFKSGEAAGAAAVEWMFGEVGVESEQVEGGGSDVVLEADFVLAAVAGSSQANGGDGLVHGALDAGPAAVLVPPGPGLLGSAVGLLEFMILLPIGWLGWRGVEGCCQG
jgi:hypothetical protein